MFEIDKRKFGAFVAQHRKEKGYTQKELAERLFLSDKAVSKWETGVSIPDIALLVPLAELLEVSVTELLMCEHMEQPCSVAPEQIETLVKTAIAFSEDKPVRAYQQKSKWTVICVIAFLVGGFSLLAAYVSGQWKENVVVFFVISAIFAIYFCFFVQMRLPRYYDENRICSYSDGIFRMNIAGVALNNRNWLHIVGACRASTCLAMGFLPVLSLLMQSLQIVWWQFAEPFVMLFLMLGMVVIPIYVVGKKYESK